MDAHGERASCRFGPGRAPRAWRGGRARLAGGFALIELLVVVAIIVILVSILVPSLRTAKQLAQIASCASNQRSSLLAIQIYASDYGSLPDVRCHPRWKPHVSGPSWDYSGSNGPIMRGYTVLWASQVDSQGFRTNRALMCPATDVAAVWQPGLYQFRLGSSASAARDADPSWGWGVTQQPYFKVLTTGMSIWHHQTVEPWGHIAFWAKGLDVLVRNKDTTSTPTCDGTLDRIMPALPRTMAPMMTCPTWAISTVHPDLARPYTPHRGKQPIVTYGFNETAPLERNIGFTDGHVTYYAKQTQGM